MNELDQLSIDELDDLIGGASIKIGPVRISVGENGVAFGLTISGLGGFILSDSNGGGCAWLGGRGVCTPH